MDKYKVIKQIGKGNYGKAFLARSSISKCLCVIKTIDTTSFNKEQLDSALYEVNVLKSLNHPYIIKYIESFHDSNLFCIVMEYADCGDMNKLVKSQLKLQIPLREEVILNWFVQLCFAVKYIHERKILHRDLKLSNVFLCSNGDIKLGDFGIAKVLNDTNDFAKTLVGTPYYLSPELCLKRSYNQKSDVWSMGCVLYELMYMRHAFEASNIGELILKILKGDFGKMDNAYSFSKELKNLVKDILVTNCEMRPDVNKLLSQKVLERYIKLNLVKQISMRENANALSHKETTKKDFNLLFERKNEKNSNNTTEKSEKNAFTPEFSWEKTEDELIIIVEVSDKVKELKSAIKSMDTNYYIRISGIKVLTTPISQKNPMNISTRKEGPFSVEILLPKSKLKLNGKKCKKLVHYHGVYEFHFDLIKDDNDDDQFAEQNFELN